MERARTQQDVRIEYRMARAHYLLGRFDAAIGHAEKALYYAERLGGTDDLCGEPVGLLGRLRCFRGEPRDAIYHCSRNVQQLQRLGRPVEEAASTGVLAFAYGLNGQFDNAYAAADRGIALAAAAPADATVAAGYFYRGVVHGWRGDLAGARDSFATALALSEQIRDPFGEYVVRGRHGEAALHAGELDEAEEDLRSCLRLGDGLVTAFHRAAFQAFLARVLLLRGREAEALELSAKALVRASGRDDAWSSSIALRVRGEVLLAAGELGEAETAVRAGAAIQKWRECHPDYARSLLTLSAILEARGDSAAAAATRADARQLFDAMGIRVSTSRAADAPRAVAMLAAAS